MCEFRFLMSVLVNENVSCLIHLTLPKLDKSNTTCKYISTESREIASNLTQVCLTVLHLFLKLV